MWQILPGGVDDLADVREPNRALLNVSEQT
jgi:hypothetical protein